MFYSLLNINLEEQYSLKKKIKFLFIGVLFYFLFSLASILLILAFDEFIVRYLEYPSIAKLFKKSKSNITREYNILTIIILVPIIEELFFRLILKPYQRNIVIFSFLLSFIMWYGGKYPNKIDLYLLLSLVCSTLFSFFIYYLLYKKQNIEKFLWEKQKITTIIFTIFFGLVHISNIVKIDTLYWQLSLFYPIYVLPQICLGYFCSILRLKLGFIWGILFHSLINLIGTSI